jgi:hypothetical protein
MNGGPYGEFSGKSKKKFKKRSKRLDTFSSEWLASSSFLIRSDGLFEFLLKNCSVERWPGNRHGNSGKKHVEGLAFA